MKASASGVKSFLNKLDEEFVRLHARLRSFLNTIPPQFLYHQTHTINEGCPGAVPNYFCVEQLLRAAAVIEQTFGGLSANLWDDPFEWTLPETLSTPERIAEYLMEVETTRRRGFLLFNDDADLHKEIVVPSGETRTILALLLETLLRAAHHEGQAVAALKLFANLQSPSI